MFEWWVFVAFCTYMGGVIGFGLGGGDLGIIFGLIGGFCVGTVPPVGPTINFDPNDL